ncbi:MAG: NAD(P)-binding domain-containing protein [Nitrospinae bacterium]|nr:NAD(P)-binding domain-containing protein [Nitrospinota bacterium]
MRTERKTVTVIGLGLMGSALARAFADAGYEFTVWNRTPEKAEPFSGIVRTSENAGIDASFPNSLLSWFVKAIERGHGADDIPSLYEAFRRP